MNLQFASGGEGPRLLVLLHGLGTNRQVWDAMLACAAARWRGTWMAPDLRGHGQSPRADSYALGLHAADVAETVAGAWSEVVVVGHSMGGVIALALGSGWFGVAPNCVLGLGIKVAWSEEELAQLTRMASAPIRWFDTRQEAIARYLKVSGLAGLVAPDSPAAGTGVTQGENGWRLAADPGAAAIGPPPMRALVAACRAPFRLGRGEQDPLVSQDQLEAFDPKASEFAGLGHNAMVQDPDAIWRWIDEMRS